MFCSKCGIENIASANFCKKCGVKIEKESTPTSVDIKNNLLNAVLSAIPQSSSDKSIDKFPLWKNLFTTQKIISFLKAMTNTQEMNRWKEETFHTQAKQNAKNDRIIKEVTLKANPGMSEVAYDAMKAAEVAAKQAKKQEELEMKAADNAHWEGIAAGKIPAGTPPPSQVAYEAIPLEIRLQMEANKDAQLLARHNLEQVRQHNARVDKTVNDLRNAEMFNTGGEKYLRQELESLKAKK